MDQMKTGSLIRALRTEQSMTQLQLAEKIGVSDKAISKWERGCGAPDLAILPILAETLGIDVDCLLRGTRIINERPFHNMKKTSFFVCPECGNILTATESADIACCGRKLSPLEPKTPDADHALNPAVSDGEWYVTSDHPMLRQHCISFVGLVTGDTVVVKKLYPEWTMEVRLPYYRRGNLVWYCTEHGLFSQKL